MHVNKKFSKDFCATVVHFVVRKDQKPGGKEAGQLSGTKLFYFRLQNT